MKNTNYSIDFIIYWVDGSDIEWQKKKAFFKGTEYQNIDARYRDWAILKYWFRAVENYAPWVNKIYFVSDGQVPAFLNTNHPKLVMTDHKDFIPEEYLPTFQANTIELNFHRIKSLSEHFVVFNDDMFINQPITPSYYFKEGLPCDGTYEHIFSGRGYDPIDKWGINIMAYCDTQVINAHFHRAKVVSQNKRGWYGSYLGTKYRLQAYLIKLFGRKEFQHFYTPHNEKAFLKSVATKVWEKEPEMLAGSCTRFRENVSLNNYFIRLWQLCENKFYPTNVLNSRKVLQIEDFDSIRMAESFLFDENCKSLCLNDSSKCKQEIFPLLKTELVQLFEKKFPKKSSFEL